VRSQRTLWGVGGTDGTSEGLNTPNTPNRPVPVPASGPPLAPFGGGGWRRASREGGYLLHSKCSKLPGVDALGVWGCRVSVLRGGRGR